MNLLELLMQRIPIENFGGVNHKTIITTHIGSEKFVEAYRYECLILTLSMNYVPKQND